MTAITFNELRRIKDSLPVGSMKTIAERLRIEEDTVRNYFGGSHYNAKEGKAVGVHFEQGPDGGIVTFDDPSIIDLARSILEESHHPVH